MLKLKIIALLCCSCLFAACASHQNEGESQMNKNTVTKISPEEAKKIMDEQEGYIILDVRAKTEFDEGHIEGAVLIPDGEIKTRAEQELTDKAATILVYCRSGRRSSAAAEILAKLGYSNVYDFGGIMSWPYDNIK